MDRLPLLATKLIVPPLRLKRTPRPRLIERLNQSLNYRLTLILAPAGFGKTTLLSEWVQQPNSPAQFAWLSLDEADNDPQRFVTYLLGALLLPDDLLWSQLAAPQPIYQAILTELINTLMPLTAPRVLILDDYHLIQDQSCHELFTFWLTHLPPHVHVVLASRIEPPLPLPRLRMRDELLQLSTTELRFTLAEATAFLHQAMALPLSLDDMRALDSRTEGWIAGLQLAALALQGAPKSTPPRELIASFGGSHRYILDYLASEVLQQQPPQVQQFLLDTAILERLTADLCDQVTGQTASQAMLMHLEMANLFIIPLDNERRWYRYHALFAEFLRHRLKQSHPERVFMLHQRAAAWCEQNQLTAEALSHALEAADVPRATRLIRLTTPRILSRSEIIALMSWLNALSDEMKYSQPRLSLFHAWALLATGQFDRVEVRLQEVLQALTSPDLPMSAQATDLHGEVNIIRATMAYVRRDMAAAIENYRQALPQLAPDNAFLRGAVALNLGLAYAWIGETRRASQALRQASEWNKTNHNFYLASVAWWNLAQLQQEQGQLYEAAESYRQIVALTPLNPTKVTWSLEELRAHSFSLDKPLLPDLSGAYIGPGQLYYEHNDLAEATRWLTVGLELARVGTDSTLINGFMTLIRVKQAQGEWQMAFELLQQAKTLIYREQISPYWAQQLQIQQARLWLAQGNWEAVKQWWQEQTLPLDAAMITPQLYLNEASYLVAIRWLMAQAKWAEAYPFITELLAQAERAGRMGRVIEWLILLAITQQALGQSSAATVARALALAEPEQFMRLFIDEGVAMAALLQRVDERSSGRAYADKILQNFGLAATEVSVEPLLEPLTDREVEILQLIAQGASNKTIAATLFLTVGTVKWYARNIYSKLNAQNRTQAVARARALRLL